MPYLPTTVKEDKGFIFQIWNTQQELFRHLQRKIAIDFSRISRTTDSSVGIVIEESKIAKHMSDAASDDVAAARQIIDSKGVKSPTAGITSSLYWNSSCDDGKLPLLKKVLGTLPGKKKLHHDTLSRLPRVPGMGRLY